MMAIDISLVGYGAALCTTCAFIPQVWQVIQSRNTESISLLMYCIFVFGVFLWCVYGVVVKDLPLIMANLVTLILAAIILAMKLRDTINKVEH